ncbi:carbohydrate-binding protein [Flammeovirga sp. MY04]|uniref:Ig-like domain-containing protein n=1 Tax=Flammeovirga sp. MY04 TaxID=1191459 RepID=UPI000824EA6E|nr:Ig-like domain-containing protein [Flammeovirga sp. MY04]ANQ52855.2 carbohydrate-binding protein [Flammeovirga sp. MY04]
MNYFTKLSRRVFTLLLLLTCGVITQAQDVNVDVNVNFKHSVNGASEFNREDYMTIHGTAFETDWDGEEDKLDYLLNDLDTYFGRDNGSATWKFSATEEDPNRPNWPSIDHMKSLGGWLKGEYEKDFNTHQYEKRSKEMILGTNPHPTYPTLSWNGDGTTWTGWQPYDVDVSAEWVVNYLDYFFRKADGEPGEPLPYYWEVINEPDMPMMTGHMTCTSQEKIWEYHNLVALGIRERFGANNPNRPKVGGMTWGLHDFHLRDGISRYDENYLDQWLEGDGYDIYHNMMDSEANNYRDEPWYQWDIMWQGFIDTCGENMDFYSIHIYDWPGWAINNNDAPSATRAGGHTEAMLDILEWYDLYKTGTRKEMIVSEFGAVNGTYNDNNRPGVYDQKRIDWECLKPFNSMFMQFLERPDYITKSMPFTPVKAVWGDIPDQNLRYPYAMMHPDANGNWEWSEYIKFFELWSNVKGTRVETKASNPDVQVNAYANGNTLYVILNNLEDNEKNINLSMYEEFGNPIQKVMIKNLYLDMNKGTAGQPALDEIELNTAPGSVKLLNDATMILEYTFANPVNLSETLEERKFMGEKIGSGTHPFGSELIHMTGTTMSTQVNNVVVPSENYEATLRIAGAFFKVHMSSIEVTLNGTVLPFDGNWRGTDTDNRNQTLAVLELEIPAGVLQANNTIECRSNAPSDWATAQIQVFDFSKAPGRSAESTVALTGLSVDGSSELMQGRSESLVASFVPEDATNKALTWSSSNTSVATVDEFGVVTAVASSGTAIITATAADGGITATHSITAIAFANTLVASVTFEEGATLDVDFYVTTPLNVTILPEDATDQEIVWTSSNPEVVSVDPNTGKIQGLVIGGAATITATVDGQSASIDVNVGIVGDEVIYCDALPQEVTGNTTYNFDVFVNLLGTREVKVEILDGSTVLGSGSTEAEVLGKEQLMVEVTLAEVPAIGEYTIKVTALEGASVITECSSTISILDRIRPESISILDWLREVAVGETVPVTAEVMPADAYDTSVNWTSSNEAIATVDANGVVTGVSVGSSVIRGTLNDGGLFEEVTIEVKSAVVVEPTAIIIPEEITIFPNGSFQVEPIFVPEWTTEKSLQWSFDDNIASVDPNGKITATANQGTLNLTVTSASSPQISAMSVVTVGTTLRIEAETFTAMGGAVGDIGIYDNAGASKGKAINNVQQGDFVEYEVYIPQGGDYEITFAAGTEVEDGVVEMFVNAASVGSKKVPTGAWDNFVPVKLDQAVTLPQGVVKIGLMGNGTSPWQWNLDYFDMAFTGEIPDCSGTITGVEIVAAESEVMEGRTIQLSDNQLPATACKEVASWSSSNSSVATVDSNGKVTGVSLGTATITVQTGSQSATIEITVIERVPIYVTGVNLTTTAIALDIHQMKGLEANVVPANADNLNVTWSSDNEGVATVDANGVVTGVAEGTATITVTTVDQSKTATATVTVSGNEYVPATEIVIEAETMENTGGEVDDSVWGGPGNGFGVNNDVGINWGNNGDWAEYTVEGNGEYEITYYISTPNDAGIAIEFVLDGNSVGEDAVPVTGGWENYQPLKSAHTVTLSGTHTVRLVASGTEAWQWNLDKFVLTPIENTTPEVINVTGVSLNSNSADLTVGETLQLPADVAPANASDKTVSWMTDNANVATVNANGLVSAVGSGVATITVTTNDGSFTATAQINVADDVTCVAPSAITIDTKPTTMDKGNCVQLTATVGPENHCTVGVVWKTSDASIVTVDTYGNLCGVAEGTVTITAETAEGGLSDSFEVMVNVPATGITIENGNVTLKVGETLQLSAVTTPVDASVLNLVWTSSDENVITIDAAGELTAVAEGVATITVTSEVGNLTASVEVTVEAENSEEPTSIDEVTVAPTVYPMPASDVVYIKGLANGNYSITLYTLEGKQMLSSSEAVNGVYELGVSGVPSGVYFLNIKGNSVDHKIKIVVK